MNRRTFLGSFGGLVATAALPVMAEEERKPDLFSGRGTWERLSINYIHVPIGLPEPFSVLHISDTHLTAVYPDESEAKRKLAAIRTRTFGGRQEEALRDSLTWAKGNADFVIHTGDMIDFQSRANYDLVRKYYGEDMTGSMGNHEFSPEMWLSARKETKDEAFKEPSRAELSAAYPFDISLQATVVKGVNFVTLDDVYGTVTAAQVAAFKAEVSKGLPIVLCMHVPFPTRANRMVAGKYWMGGTYKLHAMKFRRGLGDEPVVTDAVTRDFIAYLKGEPQLKLILCGDHHYTFQEAFSPTARQCIVGPNFLYHGQEVLFT